MRNSTKIWLIVAFVLVFVGVITFGGVMEMLKWDFSKLSTGEFETNTYSFSQTFRNISVDTSTAYVVIVPAEESELMVTCYEQKNMKHIVSLGEDTLKIQVTDTRKWYEHIGIHFSTPKITVYVPVQDLGRLSIEAQTGDIEIHENFQFESMDISCSTGDVKSYASAAGDLKIHTTTGDIHLENAAAKAIDLSVTTGKVTVSNVNCAEGFSVAVSTGKTEVSALQCNSFASGGNTGSILLKQVVARQELCVTRSTGDINIEKCDAEDIILKTSTGDVKGSILTDKSYSAKTSTGNVVVPQSGNGGRCEITTSTGDIHIVQMEK